MQGKNVLAMFIGIIGSMVTTLFGEWSAGLTTHHPLHQAITSKGNKKEIR